MKAIIVFIDAIVNTNAINMYMIAFKNAAAMIGACCKKGISQKKPVALVKDHQVRTVKISANSVLARTSVITFPIIESGAIAVDLPASFNRNIFCIHRINKNDVAVTWRYALAGRVIFSFRTAQQASMC
jgi:hypothetical protein